jgi:hypothetical protein
MEVEKGTFLLLEEQHAALFTTGKVHVVLGDAVVHEVGEAAVLVEALIQTTLPTAH